MTDELSKRITEIKDKLIKKVIREFDNFVVELYFKDVDSVLKRAYEYVIKRDLVLAIRDNYMNLSLQQLNALYNKRNLLDTMYHNWDEREVTYMDRVTETIESCCNC